jgi:hypothetical protein
LSAAATASVVSVVMNDLPFVTYRSEQERYACFCLVMLISGGV